MDDKLNCILNLSKEDLRREINKWDLEEIANVMESVILQFDDVQIKELFKKVSDTLYWGKIEPLSYVIHNKSNLKLKICFIAFIKKRELPSFGCVLYHDLVKAMKVNPVENQFFYQEILTYFDEDNYKDLYFYAHNYGLLFPTDPMVGEISKYFWQSEQQQTFFQMLLWYDKPNEQVYQMIKEYLRTCVNDKEYICALNSMNAPFEDIFTFFLEGGTSFPNFLIEMYEGWIKNNDYRAFLLEEYIYLHHIEIDLPSFRPRLGLIGNILKYGNIMNYYLIMNYWKTFLFRCESFFPPVEAQFLKIYSQKSLDLALSDYIYVGSQLDREYLEATALKREELDYFKR